MKRGDNQTVLNDQKLIASDKALIYYSSELSVFDKDDEEYIKNHIKRNPWLNGSDIIAIREYIEKAKLSKMKREKQDIGNYLTGENWKIGTILKARIQADGRLEESQFDKTKQILVIPVHIYSAFFGGTEIPADVKKDFGLSQYNENCLIDQLGGETANWEGDEFDIIVESSSKSKTGKRLSVVSE